MGFEKMHQFEDLGFVTIYKVNRTHEIVLI